MKRIITLSVALLALILIIGYFRTNATEDEIKFRREHEELNGVVNDNNNTFSTMNLPKRNGISYATEEDVIDLLQQGTGIIYFGFATCPWCRAALPEFFEVSSEFNQIDLLYLDIRYIRDLRELVNDEIVIREQGSRGYREILSILGDKASIYRGLNDDNIRRIYAPTFIFVRNGQIVGIHEGTVDSQDDPWTPLTTQQQNELREIYRRLFVRINENTSKCPSETNQC